MKLFRILFAIPALISLLNSGCRPAQPEAINPLPQEASPPTTTLELAVQTPTLPDRAPAETMRLRIRLLTTSDWTDLYLVSGGTWIKHELISADENATTAEVYGEQLILDQPISRAEAGLDTEMTADIQLNPDTRGKPLVFMLERGDIGYSQVEFLRYINDAWVVIKTIRWDGITGDGKNEYITEIRDEGFSDEIALPTKGSVQEAEAASVAPVIGMPQGTDGYPWWNDAVFYEIFVRSFYDSNGDGIGDLNGITEKLDYLNDGDPATSTDLGITGIWLMPIFSSSSYHGYNVTDFYTVNPDYGTENDLKKMLEEAHARGIRVILDITINHTSNQHPWFISACDPASPYHDWYIWSDYDPGYTGYWGEQVWFPYNDLYYYGTFSANFPDLNYKHPAVVAEMQNVVRFWLEDIGVDGFRLDAAKHIIEDGTIQGNSASTHAWWESFRTFYKEVAPHSMTVGEIWDTTEITAEYLQGDEFDLSFEFYLAYAFIHSVKEGSADLLNDQIELSYQLIPSHQFATFLTNHDQDRLMNQVGFDPQKALVAASLLMTSPGVPFVYYGEEIGMQGQKPDEQIRSPMQWSAVPFTGFSIAAPWEAVGPGWEENNVILETDDPTSILSHYRNLIQARSQHAALRVGDLSVVATGNDALYGIMRVSKEEAILVLINLSGQAVTDYSLQLAQSSLAQGSYTLVLIMGEGEITPVTISSGGGFSQFVPLAEIPPYATFILQLNAP
jgi:alpha-amylase